MVIFDDAKDVTVEKDGKDFLVWKFFPGQEMNILYANIESKSCQGLFKRLCGDMGHQGQVFDQPASLSFGGIWWAQHTPLTGLQGTRATDFSSLLKLWVDSGHHSWKLVEI